MTQYQNTTRKVATRNKTRTIHLKEIHVAAQRAGFQTRVGAPGREMYENELVIVCGRTSSRQSKRVANARPSSSILRRSRLTSARPTLN